MRILSLANKVPYPRKDGGAIGIINVIEGYADAGNEVTLLAMNTDKHHVMLQDIPLSLREKIEFELVDVPAKITPPGAIKNLLFSHHPYIATRFIVKQYETALTELLTHKTFDIIQLEGLYLCPYIALIRKLSSAQLVFRAHNVEHEIWSRTVEVSRGLKKIYLRHMTRRLRRFEQSFMNQYDLLMPVTQRDGDTFTRMGNKKPLAVLQPGMTIPQHQPQLPTTPVSVCFIGALDWAPNQLGLLWFLENVWPMVQKARPELQFHIAGRNAPDDLICNIKGTNVYFEGEVEDATEYLGQHHIMVVPLLSGSGLRIKIIEGMAQAKPIVATAIGAEGLPVNQGKEIVIANEAETFAQAIIDLTTKPDTMRKLADAAYRLVKTKFNYRETVKPALAFFEKACSR